MSDPQREVWLQVTAGQGPVECAWAVIKVVEQIRREAVSAGFTFKTIEIEPGAAPGTAVSALVSLAGGGLGTRGGFPGWYCSVDCSKPIQAGA